MLPYTFQPATFACKHQLATGVLYALQVMSDDTLTAESPRIAAVADADQHPLPPPKASAFAFALVNFLKPLSTPPRDPQKPLLTPA